MKTHLFSYIVIAILLFSCIERGKPQAKEDSKQTSETSNKPTLEHYTCPNGHKGSDKQGVCGECNAAFVHNQAFHGTNLNVPKPALQDPFSNAPASQSAPSPAQNAYGDYHYNCPNGHPGGSGSAGTCTSCDAKLVHNQLYHK